MKEKLILEYPINSSPKVLYSRLSTPGGLAEWFADDVNLRDGIYTFEWDGSEQQAEVSQAKDNKYIRFKWIDEPDAYFEFRINVDEITKDVALVITDIIDPDEIEDTTELWNSQVSELKHIIGL
jgi:uncharacterized protein YndB with AHSA1/START domain